MITSSILKKIPLLTLSLPLVWSRLYHHSCSTFPKKHCIFIIFIASSPNALLISPFTTYLEMSSLELLVFAHVESSGHYSGLTVSSFHVFSIMIISFFAPMASTSLFSYFLHTSSSSITASCTIFSSGTW